jgi:hypothetical protein
MPSDRSRAAGVSQIEICPPHALHNPKRKYPEVGQRVVPSAAALTITQIAPGGKMAGEKFESSKGLANSKISAVGSVGHVASLEGTRSDGANRRPSRCRWLQLPGDVIGTGNVIGRISHQIALGERLATDLGDVRVGVAAAK